MTIGDNYSNVNLAIGVGIGFRCPANDVVTTLEAAVKERGVHGRIRWVNVPEIVPDGFGLWAYANGVTLDFPEPGNSHSHFGRT